MGISYLDLSVRSEGTKEQYDNMPINVDSVFLGLMINNWFLSIIVDGIDVLLREKQVNG